LNHPRSVSTSGRARKQILISKFLLIFKKIVEDHSLVAVFRRHYKLVKEITDVPPATPGKPENLPS
jgi:uncharacterized protein (DUF2336 family)